MPSSEQIVRTAVQVRAEAPMAWGLFLKAVRSYANEIVSEMVRCDQDKLVRAQGMAIALNEIAKILEDAPEIHQKALEVQMRRNARG